MLLFQCPTQLDSIPFLHRYRAEETIALLSIFRIFRATKTKVSVAPQHLDALRRFKAQIFQALAHPTRIHIMETLADRELSVGAILKYVKVEPTNLSQHLSVLRLKNLVITRKVGNQVLYSVRDPLIIEVLDIMRRYFQRHFEEAIEMHKHIEDAR